MARCLGSRDSAPVRPVALLLGGEWTTKVLLPPSIPADTKTKGLTMPPHTTTGAVAVDTMLLLLSTRATRPLSLRMERLHMTIMIAGTTAGTRKGLMAVPLATASLPLNSTADTADNPAVPDTVGTATTASLPRLTTHLPMAAVRTMTAATPVPVIITRAVVAITVGTVRTALLLTVEVLLADTVGAAAVTIRVLLLLDLLSTEAMDRTSRAMAALLVMVVADTVEAVTKSNPTRVNLARHHDRFLNIKGRESLRLEGIY